MTVYNDAFFIWHDGPYGTINGIRLACVLGQQVAQTPAASTAERAGSNSLTNPRFAQVDWTQVNAALGYFALLLAAVCTQTGCKFSEYVGRVTWVSSTAFSAVHLIDTKTCWYDLLVLHVASVLQVSNCSARKFFQNYKDR